jgi:hypothetical protein
VHREVGKSRDRRWHSANLLGRLARQIRGSIIHSVPRAANRALQPQPGQGGSYHYLRERCDFGLAGSLTGEEVGLAVAVRRRRLSGVLTSGLRSEGPLMRMVTQ